jgi:hypothetical protein
MATQRNTGGRGGRARASGRRQAQDGGDPAGEQVTERTGEPDVLLDVPKLTVDEIGLEVDNLRARIALQARLADLIQLHVGADVEVERVALEIKGVEAQAQLKARLDNVLAIVERALETVDQHPEILTELARSTADAAGALGEGVATAASGRELKRGAPNGDRSEGRSKRQTAKGRS